MCCGTNRFRSSSKSMVFLGRMWPSSTTIESTHPSWIPRRSSQFYGYRIPLLCRKVCITRVSWTGMFSFVILLSPFDRTKSGLCGNESNRSASSSSADVCRCQRYIDFSRRGESKYHDDVDQSNNQARQCGSTDSDLVCQRQKRADAIRWQHISSRDFSRSVFATDTHRLCSGKRIWQSSSFLHSGLSYEATFPLGSERPDRSRARWRHSTDPSRHCKSLSNLPMVARRRDHRRETRGNNAGEQCHCSLVVHQKDSTERSRQLYSRGWKHGRQNIEQHSPSTEIL